MAEEQIETLDFSSQGLKKINKASDAEAKRVAVLILDDNELQKLDSVDSYHRLEKLSAAKNALLRMYGVGKLLCLRELNLSNNAILQIEGLKELVYLKKLILSGNNIKSIEQLNNNINLEYLDLSDNQISHISDISYLKHLKHFHLEKNRIGNLRQCERYLPPSLISFGIANNFLADLNTLCHLSHLESLENFTIEGNPCVTTHGHEKINFDYRPFVINWIMSVKLLDGYDVNAIESLKAEWLYSQGKGRQFREGEHTQLVQYLSTTCPSGDAAPETEEQRKLRLILSKAQHHQQQLREQGPSSPRPKQSPRMHARITGHITKSPDRAMSSSYHSALSNKQLLSQHNSMSTSFSGEIPLNISSRSVINKQDMLNSVMSQSFDSSSEGVHLNAESEKVQFTPEKHDKSELKKIQNEVENKKCKENTGEETKLSNQPLEAASKMVPVPESMMSPDYQGPTFTPSNPLLTIAVHKRNMSVNSNQSNSPPSSHYSAKNANNANVSAVSSQLIIHNEQPIFIRGGKTPTKVNPNQAKTTNQQLKTTKGSPQLSRSAMSSPKMKHCTEKRKGSFSSRSPQKTDDVNSTSVKNTTSLTNSSNVHKSKIVDKTQHENIKNTSSTPPVDNQVTPQIAQEKHSSDDDSEMCVEKLQSIRNAANERRKKQSISDSGSSENVSNTNKSGLNKTKQAHSAAITIQKLWRGYRTRNLNIKAGSILQSIQSMRARQYIEKLSCDVEATRAALDNERKIQQLQMQAINALWKKISAMEGENKGKDGKNDYTKSITELLDTTEKSDDKESKDLAVKELTQTCSLLQAQVQQLQGSMKEILQFVSNRHSATSDSCADGIATQTEITAVHTPQGDPGTWPYQKIASRPCSLSLNVQTNSFKQTSVNGTDKIESILETEEPEQLPGQTDTKNTVTTSRSVGEKEVSTDNSDNCQLSEDLKSDCLGSVPNACVNTTVDVQTENE